MAKAIEVVYILSNSLKKNRILLPAMPPKVTRWFTYLYGINEEVVEL
ncbi:MAG: hypothetical protein PHD43_15915 [Methylococcales bacterium]|nr:hypothetical protein [Methylococcales bacterium]